MKVRKSRKLRFAQPSKFWAFRGLKSKTSQRLLRSDYVGQMRLRGRAEGLGGWSLLLHGPNFVPFAGTKTQKAQGIPDNAEIFTQDAGINPGRSAYYVNARISGAFTAYTVTYRVWCLGLYDCL